MKFISKLLMKQHMKLCKEISQAILDCASHDAKFMKTIITADETSVYGMAQKTSFNLHNENIINFYSQKSMTGLQQCESDQDLFF